MGTTLPSSDNQGKALIQNEAKIQTTWEKTDSIAWYLETSGTERNEKGQASVTGFDLYDRHFEAT